MPSLLAVSDLRVGYIGKRETIASVQPEDEGDWLIVAGDVGERFSDIVWTLKTLRSRFAKVIWAPGNRDLWTQVGDPVTARGVLRYEQLVLRLRAIDVTTPEDPYPVWEGDGGPLVIAPLFLLYDYTFRPAGAASKQHAMELADRACVDCLDEELLFADPFPSVEEWAAARREITRARLDALPDDARTILVNHYPLVREPIDFLEFPEFALWCGTDHTADWPERYRADAVVFGHLHVPLTTCVDGIPHYDVSFGAPQEYPVPRRVIRVPEGELLVPAR